MCRSLIKTVAATAIAAALSAPAMAQDISVAAVVFQQDQFFRTIELGMEAAAEAAGVELLQGNSDSRLDREISLIDTYIARGVDAIVISPISATASIPALQRAHNEGIVIITYNSAIDADFPASYLNSSQRDLGESTGAMANAFIAEQFDGEADIATLGFAALLPEISGDRVNGFLDVAGDGNTLNIVAQQDAWLAEDAVQVAGDIITANPDLDIIYAANEGGTVGAVQAVRNAGRQGEVFVFGIDGSDQLAGFLLDEDDVLHGVTAQQPFEMGREAVNSALAVIAGDEVEETVIVPVLGLMRIRPDEVIAFREALSELQ